MMAHDLLNCDFELRGPSEVTAVQTRPFSATEDYNGQDETDTESSATTGSSNSNKIERDEITEGQASNCGSTVDVGEDEDEELPLLEYARNHGLTTDYLNKDPVSRTHLLHSEAVLTHGPDRIASDTAHDLVFETAQAKADSDERWDVDRETAQFLSGVVLLGKNDHSETMYGLRTSPALRDLCLEEPILLSDPELDLNRLKERNTVSVSTSSMNPFPLNEENDEGASMPVRLAKSCEERMKQYMHERLDVDVETMEYIKEIHDPPRLDEQITIAAAWTSERRTPAQTPLTPPLLPLSPPFSPGGISQSVCEMDLTSSPDDLIAKEAIDIGDTIMAGDKNSMDHSAPKITEASIEAIGREYCGNLQTPNQSSSSPYRRKRIADLEADVPLLAQDTIEPPAKKAKSVSFTEQLHTLIPSTESMEESMDPNLDIDAFITEVAAPLADSIMHQIETETLSEFDTTLRIKVPSLDTAELMPPWRAYKNSSDIQNQTAVMSRIKHESTSKEKRWAGISDAERILPWSPFPTRMGKVEVDESFDDGSLARYMAEMNFEDRIDAESLLWKPEGMRILDAHDSDSDDIESVSIDDDDSEEDTAPPEAQHPTQTDITIIHTTTAPFQINSGKSDMRTLLLKRKLELEAANGVKKMHTSQYDTEDGTAEITTHAAAKSTKSAELVQGGGLLGFMRLHRGHCLDNGTNPQHSVVQQSTSTVPALPEIEPIAEVTLSKATVKPLPAPNFSDTSRTIFVVVSSTFMANRQLVRQVQNLMPSIELIERCPIQTSTTTSQCSTNRDADIALSSSTGLLVTSLQKLKQRPLPGQHSYFGVRERIELVSSSYQRLIVLISDNGQTIDGGPSTARSLDARDAEALADLTGFTVSLDTDVETYYIPGSELELAKWIVASASHHAIQDDDAKLLHDETLWERLLRTAGMNAFAAQVILAKLKMPENFHGSDISSTQASSTAPAYGLAAFVQMSAEQRVEQFGPVMGGDRVLARCSESIDREWMSVSSEKVR